MTNPDEIEQLAEQLRREPYHLLKDDCLTKSARLKKKCLSIGVKARVVVCLGLARAKWFNRWLTIPDIHGWCEVSGKRIETSRILGSSGIWGIVPVNIKPIIRIRI